MIVAMTKEAHTMLIRIVALDDALQQLEALAASLSVVDQLPELARHARTSTCARSPCVHVLAWPPTIH
jgi:hypothetical protein